MSFVSIGSRIGLFICTELVPSHEFELSLEVLLSSCLLESSSASKFGTIGNEGLPGTEHGGYACISLRPLLLVITRLSPTEHSGDDSV